MNKLYSLMCSSLKLRGIDFEEYKRYDQYNFAGDELAAAYTLFYDVPPSKVGLFALAACIITASSSLGNRLIALDPVNTYKNTDLSVLAKEKSNIELWSVLLSRFSLSSCRSVLGVEEYEKLLIFPVPEQIAAVCIKLLEKVSV